MPPYGAVFRRPPARDRAAARRLPIACGMQPQAAARDEQLCVRCAGTPAVYLIRPHGVGYCAGCYLDDQRYAPGLATA